LERFFENSRTDGPVESGTVPVEYWSVRPVQPLHDGPGPATGTEELLFRGAVLVHVSGRRQEVATETADRQSVGARAALSPEPVAALEEPPGRPGLELFKLLKADGVLAPAALVAAMLLAAAGVVVEALLFRGLLDVGRELGLVGQRLGALSALL